MNLEILRLKRLILNNILAILRSVFNYTIRFERHDFNTDSIERKTIP